MIDSKRVIDSTGKDIEERRLGVGVWEVVERDRERGHRKDERERARGHRKYEKERARGHRKDERERATSSTTLAKEASC